MQLNHIIKFFMYRLFCSVLCLFMYQCYTVLNFELLHYVCYYTGLAPR